MAAGFRSRGTLPSGWNGAGPDGFHVSAPPVPAGRLSPVAYVASLAQGRRQTAGAGSSALAGGVSIGATVRSGCGLGSGMALPEATACSRACSASTLSA